MKKSAIALAVAGVLLLFALLFPYTNSDGFTHRGLPLGYYKTINTHGLCIGYLDETTSPDGGCFGRKFPLNYAHLAIDLAICGVLAVGLVYFTEGKRRRA